MPKDTSLNKILVIGSGPIIIGQAAEFDYAGTQACKALREEGVKVVLVNSNPATIMTDMEMADEVYIQPLTVEAVTSVIARERPDGLLPTLGGQTGLNMAVELAKAGVLEKYGVRILGTSLSAIEKAEDREKFKETMLSIGEPIPESTIAESLEEAFTFAEKTGFPIIVRPAYTLGGTGGGIAQDDQSFREIVSRGLNNSPIHQVLLEQSVAGWKEIEYEVIRDAADNCITVCNMENIDPIGVHTGDSIVVAPSQTLSNREYQMLRNASFRIIRALRIEGGCNVQLALNPDSFEYVVIEVNPRVSRSSALASKATGYPIAKIVSKIALGYTLDEIRNAVTKETFACFEPALDYVVMKIPRWPFDKFRGALRTLGTQMKATGEVMAIERSFEAALQKAVRSLEIGLYGLRLPALADLSRKELERKIKHTDDERLFAIAEGFRKGLTCAEIHEWTKIDFWFLEKIKLLVDEEASLPHTLDQMTAERWRRLKRLGFADRYLASLWKVEEDAVRQARQKAGETAVYKMVDTCAAEFEAHTSYYYSTYETEDEVTSLPGRRVLVLGSGPIRIGQGIEFDYCSVQAAWALREMGIHSVIVNNNPETVSTDFDTSDHLYFEPLTVEDVMAVIEREQPDGVLVQFGGQSALNLAGPLDKAGIPILGTPVEKIDLAEDRGKFSIFLQKLGVPQTEGASATSMMEAMGIALKLGFPLMVRPSYVIGGRAMEIVHNEHELHDYMQLAAQVSPEYPILIDRYILGKEVEIDAVADGVDVFITGIMEHVERAGVHSGDSMAVYPPRNLTTEEINQVVDYTIRIGRALGVKGLLNIQFVVKPGGEVCVLEVNPRASRTVPVLSKATGVPLVKLATRVSLGESLKELGYHTGLMTPPPYWTVKAPVFSFEKLGLVDISLGPEMKSTGEVLGMDEDYAGALYKAITASGARVPLEGTILVSIADRDKEESLPVLTGLAKRGFTFLATRGTADFLKKNGLHAETVYKIGEGLPDVLKAIKQGRVGMVVNTPTRGKTPARTGFAIRRAAVEYGVPCFTSLDTLQAVLYALQTRGTKEWQVKSLTDYQEIREELKP
ncbi:MAG TPA: carbamoyl-phosphate synthase large subunit [Firmicutes bacterium]|nr:carbamoyl-phosphate synthase large subunit [Bacillota bacterium]